MNKEGYYEQKRDEMIDDRLCEGLCIRCANPMPKEGWTPTTVIGKPAKCPICAPYQWNKEEVRANPRNGKREPATLEISHFGEGKDGWKFMDGGVWPCNRVEEAEERLFKS